ncbi:hypothetical protein [Bartonella apis]|uniref:hypothetical protein n=1 Tax=Bartonella apis TaxID=1686310 RepID=UPI00243196D2|nr:hypothetical protein [Bartonella apis]
MTLILGLDVATMTGFALYSVGERLSTIKTGTISIRPDKDEKDQKVEKKVVHLGYQLERLYKAHQPDFVAIEEPLRNVVSYRKKNKSLFGAEEEITFNPDTIQLLALASMAAFTADRCNIPWITIPSQTWRKHFLGFGRKTGWKRADWKRAAIERCRLLHIPVKNNDAAEAVGVAIAGAASQDFKLMNLKASK